MTLSRTRLPDEESDFLRDPWTWEPPALGSLAKATVAQAVSISARFPYLSPEAPVGVEASDRPVGLLSGRFIQDSRKQSARRSGARPPLGLRRFEPRASGRGSGFSSTAATSITLAWDRHREAMRFVNAQRSKEPADGPPDARRFSHTHLRVVHFVNDPGMPCLPLDSDWRHQLSPRASRFIDLTELESSCQRDVVELEESLQPRPLSSLLAPIEALLAVREEHSRQTPEELLTFEEQA